MIDSGGRHDLDAVAPVQVGTAKIGQPQPTADLIATLGLPAPVLGVRALGAFEISLAVVALAIGGPGPAAQRATEAIVSAREAANGVPEAQAEPLDHSHSWARGPGRWLAWPAIMLIRLYQRVLSPVLPNICRLRMFTAPNRLASAASSTHAPRLTMTTSARII